MEYELISIDHAAEPVFGVQKQGPHVMRVHAASVCKDDPSCVIHKPSDHHMRGWLLNWRGDRFRGMMERICPHGIGHPDPDDLAFKRRTWGDAFADTEGVHGCDGCCTPG